MVGKLQCVMRYEYEISLCSQTRPAPIYPDRTSLLIPHQRLSLVRHAAPTDMSDGYMCSI